MPYLRAQDIFTSLNHVASGINGPVTGSHIAALLPWVDALEIRNGSRLVSQNRTAVGLAAAHGKTGTAGSDAHTTFALGRTWVDAPAATNRAEFLRELRAGRVQVGGRHGGYFRLANDIARSVVSFYREKGGQLIENPFSWQRHALWWGGLACMPVVAIPFLLAAGHFLLEGRFQPATALRPGRHAAAKAAAGAPGGRLTDSAQPVRVAVLTDNDFAKVNGVTTALSAVLRCAPGRRPAVHLHPRELAARRRAAAAAVGQPVSRTGARVGARHA